MLYTIRWLIFWYPMLSSLIYCPFNQQIPQSFRVIFETSDLLYASPATVSRCAIIRVTEDVVPFDVLKMAWLKRSKIPVELKDVTRQFVHDIVKPSAETVQRSASNCIFPATTSYLFQVIHYFSCATSLIEWINIENYLCRVSPDWLIHLWST